jgi:hypothetical protein
MKSGVAEIFARDHALFMTAGVDSPGVEPFKEFRVVTAGFKAPSREHINLSHVRRNTFNAALFVTVTENKSIDSHAKL